MAVVPIIVFTGFLGAGKTTIILNFIKQLVNVKTAWLKNEFGDIAVDSVLAHENSIATKEILNGCLCCTLTGRLGDGIRDVLLEYTPDLIVIETSGSAYPGPIAWEIRRLIQTGLNVILDAVINVIDVENFGGYEDTSYTAKLQTRDTDLILLNKHEALTAERIDIILDDVYELNPDTPKVKTNLGWISAELLLGLHGSILNKIVTDSADERSILSNHHQLEVQVLSLNSKKKFSEEVLAIFLKSLSPDYFYRVKGVFESNESGFCVVNWAFGKVSFSPISNKIFEQYSGTRLSFIGRNIIDDAQFKAIVSGLNLDTSIDQLNVISTAS